MHLPASLHGSGALAHAIRHADAEANTARYVELRVCTITQSVLLILGFHPKEMSLTYHYLPHKVPYQL